MSKTANRPGATAITVVLASVGGLVLAGTGVSAAFAGAAQLAWVDESQQLDVAGVASLNLDVAANDLVVRFDDVSEARLETRGAFGSDWTFEVDGGELIVSSPDRSWGWFTGGGWWDGGSSATLTLPQSMSGVDADLNLQAGSLHADGEFGELVLEMGAGSMTVDGSAEVLDAQVSAGNAEISLDGVREASYTVSAGWVESSLSTVPTSTSIDVSAGSLTLSVPDADYRVTRDTSAGSLESDLSESPTAANSVDVKLSAGSVELRVAG